MKILIGILGLIIFMAGCGGVMNYAMNQNSSPERVTSFGFQIIFLIVGIVLIAFSLNKKSEKK